MKRKIILSLALTALLIAIFAISASAATPVKTWDISNTSSDNVTAYLYNDENRGGYYTLTISGTGDMKNFSYPDYAPWYSSYRSEITSVTIEEGVSSIGNYAIFWCESLTSVVIPEGVTSIGDYAFYKSSSLTSIVIPEGVTSIGDYAFGWCSNLTSIVIPEGVTSIGDFAFFSCYKLTSIAIPESVTTIGEYAFYECSSLTNIVIPEGVTSIGYAAFTFCSSLTIYCEAESKPSGWDYYWNYSNNRPVVWGHSHSYDSATDLCVCGAKNNYVEKWDISNNVTTYLYNDENNAGYYTLTISGTGDMKNWFCDAPWYSSYGSKITSVTIEEGVSSIGDYAFWDCSSLTSIEIPESVTTIGGYAFYYCSSLTSIVIPESVTSIGENAFCYCSSLTSIVIPKGVSSIGDEAFFCCSNLTSIVIPEGVTSIGNNAFCYCSSLTSVELPEGVTSIGDGAFWDCSNLTSIVIPESVTTIGSTAFSGCSSLTSIVIPEGVSSIGNGAFEYCSSLTSIMVEENNQYYKTIDGNLYTKDGKTLIQYAIGKKDTSFNIPESVTSIGSSVFIGCTSLTSIVIPDSVTSIGNYAFWDCNGLTSIEIPESVTTIGGYAFYYCSSLTSIVIPESVTTIGGYAFRNCTSLTIYCEAESQPSGWNSYWNYSNRPVVWDCNFDANACLNSIFTFKGYSFSANGGFAVGFAIDYDALAKYEANTGKTLEIGVVFAGYDNLGGKQPLDQNGEAIELDLGMVKKAEITSLGYKYYDFMLTGFVDSIKDTKLVIAGYIFDGEAVKYVQANGMSDTVNGITYNEAFNG